MLKTKVGHINFLNVLPLTYGYKHGYSEGLSIKYDIPSALNNAMKNDELDISPISSIEYAKMNDKLLLLPDICIKAERDVQSIVLLSKKNIYDITDDNITLTAKSATSHCLLKIILSQKYGANPKYNVKHIDVANPILENTTASLFIGDDALQIYLNTPSNLYCYDLGKEWFDFTGHSMVYAVWTVRKDFANNFADALSYSYNMIISGMHYGIKNKDLTIKSVINKTFFNYNQLNYYLGNIIKWDLNDKDINALITYYKWAHKCNLIEKVPEIKFANVDKLLHF